MSSTNTSYASFASPVPGVCLVSRMLVQFTTLAFHCTSDHVLSAGISMYLTMNNPPPPWRSSPTRAMASSFLMRFLDHTQRRTTVGRTPLDERSARRRDLYLTTHNNHNTQTSMPQAEFEPKISAGERPQTLALDRAATGIDTEDN